jgi:hypothetical protein
VLSALFEVPGSGTSLMGRRRSHVPERPLTRGWTNMIAPPVTRQFRCAMGKWRRPERFERPTLRFVVLQCSRIFSIGWHANITDSTLLPADAIRLFFGLPENGKSRIVASERRNTT